jgi:hypothetical protein
MKKFISAFLLAFAGSANAGVIVHTSQSDFSQLGDIKISVDVQNYLPPMSEFSYYNAHPEYQGNLYRYLLAAPQMNQSYISVRADDKVSLFGFNFASLNSTQPIWIDVGTTSGESYHFLKTANDGALSFLGLEFTQGEYMTGLYFGNYFSPELVGLTDIQVGAVSQHAPADVPEPTGPALLALGAAALAYRRRNPR